MATEQMNRKATGHFASLQKKCMNFNALLSGAIKEMEENSFFYFDSSIIGESDPIPYIEFSDIISGKDEDGDTWFKQTYTIDGETYTSTFYPDLDQAFGEPEDLKEVISYLRKRVTRTLKIHRSSNPDATLTELSNSNNE